MKNAEGNRRIRLDFLLVVVSALLYTGCGPVGYIHNVVIKAESSVARAKTNDAAQYAPYEYYGAVAYLEQARIRAGFGDFQTAMRYGKKSHEMAKKAVELTAERLEEKEDIGLPQEISGAGAGDEEEKKTLEVEMDPGSGDEGGGDPELPPSLD